ncbi:hypothetical protein C7T94_10555 [Pedobacter yulinensis]|uniref:Thiamine phosphate synthase/TenI domain-containing protein n=1 Tax=Pedobacter yulinensis TaxID=2126353 RepID=A0A2T3HKW6_9SPHI|nr:thiamine phosphate synthase [Pedobacter yulinensis]PST83053.1 hypothetical protein C7T94_10555 [Pedobacter yulinensis]
MLVVVSHPDLVHNELAQVNQMFAAGMEYFHLRKPGLSRSGQLAYLAGIRPEFRNRVALHQHHDLAEQAGTRRLHDRTEARHSRSRFEPDIVYSTSVHAGDTGLPPGHQYSYAFFGPVFQSISKPGYGAGGNQVSAPPLPQIRMVAIGGITGNNCSELLHRGFASIAVLGSIWQAGDPVAAYLSIQETWNKKDPWSSV